MINLRIILAILVVTLIDYNCANKGSEKRVKIGNSYVDAKFIDDTIIDGTAHYYDSLGTLYNVSNYRKGIKDGMSVNYYSNQVISDSVEYKNGKESGYWRHFDIKGGDTYGNFYYYGLQFGPELIFKNDHLQKYLFSDLDRKIIIACDYDDGGKIDTNFRYEMQFALRSVKYDAKPVLNLFGFLPFIPHAGQTYSLGITNKEHADKELAPLSGHDFLIDTLLAVPPSGWRYFIGCNLKTNDGSFHKYYILELAY